MCDVERTGNGTQNATLTITRINLPFCTLIVRCFSVQSCKGKPFQVTLQFRKGDRQYRYECKEISPMSNQICLTKLTSCALLQFRSTWTTYLPTSSLVQTISKVCGEWKAWSQNEGISIQQAMYFNFTSISYFENSQNEDRKTAKDNFDLTHDFE